MKVLYEFMQIIFTMLIIIYVIVASVQYFFGLSDIISKVVKLII